MEDSPVDEDRKNNMEGESMGWMEKYIGYNVMLAKSICSFVVQNMINNK